MKKHLKLTRYFTWALLMVIVLQTPASIVAMEEEQQPLSPQKQNLVQRLAADYKETWQLYKQRKAGGTLSPAEQKKLEERMKSIRKAAIRAGIIAAFIAALFVGKWGYGKYRTSQEEARQSREEARQSQLEEELLEAIRNNNLEEVKRLIEAGANPKGNDPSTKVLTPLIYAAMQGNIPIAMLLIDKGADVNQKNSFGYTPLHTAASHNNLDMVKYLLSRRANANIKNWSNDLPLHFAIEKKNKEMTLLLLGQTKASLFEETPKKRVSLLIEQYLPDLKEAVADRLRLWKEYGVD